MFLRNFLGVGVGVQTLVEGRDNREGGARDRSEITEEGGGEGHYLCREGHNFSNKILGGSLFFLPKLREGHNFFIAKPADLNQSVLVTIFQLTGPSAWIEIEA